MNVLVTGGLGFLGSHVVDELVGRGASVRVLDSGAGCWLDEALKPMFANLAAPVVELNRETAGWATVLCHLAGNHPVARSRAGLGEALRARVGLLTEVLSAPGCGVTAAVTVAPLEFAFTGFAGLTERTWGGAPRVFGALVEAQAAFHRRGVLSQHLLLLPHLYGPRQVPGAGVVPWLLTGEGNQEPFLYLGWLAYVRDAAAAVADLCLHPVLSEGVHRRYLVGCHAGYSDLNEQFKEFGRLYTPNFELFLEGEEEVLGAEPVAAPTPLPEGVDATKVWYRAWLPGALPVDG